MGPNNRRALIAGPTAKGFKQPAAPVAEGTKAPVTPAAKTPPAPVTGINPDSQSVIKNGTGTGEDVLKSVDFKPEVNPMNELFQGTYYFSFYLDTDVEANQGKGSEFVIAETGLTGMNIQNVEIDTFVGPNIRSRNANATSITIKIYEPLGAMFPDLLFQAAVRMNIRNYLKAPWFLSLKLQGYDEFGKPQTVGNGWKWKLALIDVASQISESGSLHTITAMPINEVALNNQFCVLPNNTSADGATVGEALKNVIDSLNKSVIERYGPTHPPFIEYAVEEKPYPYDTKVGIKSPFEHRILADQPQDSNQTNTKDYNTQTSHFMPGDDFPGIVDRLMSRSDTAIMMARISREKPPTDGPDNEVTVKDVFSILHRIDTKVEYLNYNTVLGDYCKKITYVIKPFTSLRLLTSMGRARSFDREKTLNTQKAAFAVGKMFLKKQYDYMFTGLNTEVEKFDINVNFRWAVSVPIIQRAFGGDPARVNNATDASDAQAQLAISNNELEARRADTKAANDAAPADPKDEAATKARQQKIDEAVAAEKAAKLKNDQLGTIAAQATDAVNAKADAAAARRPIPQGRTTNGEDDIYENSQSDSDGNAKGGYGGAGNNDTSYLPVTIFRDADDPAGSTRTGTSTDNNPNKGIYGTLLNQLYGSFDGNLQSLELDIRGDPYWLGPGSTGQLFDEDSTATTPNFMNGEHMFVFRFKLPQGFDETTASVSIPKDKSTAGSGSGSSDDTSSSTNATKAPGGNSNIFTGFYATTQVTNHFRDGRFSQTLNASRIPGWKYENIIEGRAVVADDDTVVDNSPGPASSGYAGGPAAGSRGAGSRSGSGTRGQRNNNPGNLRNTPYAKRQPGYQGGDADNFAIFDTTANGIRAQENLLAHNYVTQPTTVTKIIDKYLGANVPGNINSAASKQNYINYVTKKLGSSIVQPGDVSNLASAMRNFENGTR